MSAFLPDKTRLSEVRLRTGNLERAVDFYTGTIGLRVVERQRSKAALGAAENGPAIIVLHEERHATPRPARATGLYHMAIRYPAWRDLAHALQRLRRDRYPIQGASDHLVSAAIYLSDPDANGVELYVDRPASQWIWRQGQVTLGTELLDLDELLASTAGQAPPRHVPPRTDLGHIHLHVADLAAAERFYHEFFGLAVTQRNYPGALFLSAGGYHHHLAVNTWAGDRVPPADSIGLISYRWEVPEREILFCLRHRAPLAGYQTSTEIDANGAELLRIRDPNGHWLELQHAQNISPLAQRRRGTTLKPSAQIKHENKH